METFRDDAVEMAGRDVTVKLDVRSRGRNKRIEVVRSTVRKQSAPGIRAATDGSKEEVRRIQGNRSRKDAMMSEP